MKIALICSHGGHLTELLYLMDAFDGHDKFFITYDNIRTRNLKYRKYLFPNFGEKPYKMFFNIHIHHCHIYFFVHNFYLPFKKKFVFFPDRLHIGQYWLQ